MNRIKIGISLQEVHNPRNSIRIIDWRFTNRMQYKGQMNIPIGFVHTGTIATGTYGYCEYNLVADQKFWTIVDV